MLAARTSCRRHASATHLVERRASAAAAAAAGDAGSVVMSGEGHSAASVPARAPPMTATSVSTSRNLPTSRQKDVRKTLELVQLCVCVEWVGGLLFNQGGWDSNSRASWAEAVSGVCESGACHLPFAICEADSG